MAAEAARTIPGREHGGNVDIKHLTRGCKVRGSTFLVSPPAVSLQSARPLMLARDWPGLLLPSCWLLPPGICGHSSRVGGPTRLHLARHALVAPVFCMATKWQLQVQPAQALICLVWLSYACVTALPQRPCRPLCLLLGRLCTDSCSRALSTPPACSCMLNVSVHDPAAEALCSILRTGECRSTSQCFWRALTCPWATCTSARAMAR